MKISLDWIREYVAVDLPRQELVDRLTMAGWVPETVEEKDGDLILDLETYANRPDALGHLGIAREIGAMLGRPLLERDWPVVELDAATAEIADVQIDDGPSGAMVTVIERNSLSTANGLCVVEERDMCMLSEARADAATKTAPAIPGEAKWKQTVEPNTPLLFRFSAIRFNSHRIHYDRDYVTKVEKLPGLVVQSSLISQLLIEMCRRELPSRRMTNFDFQNLRSVYDSGGEFTLAGLPSADGNAATLWALDGEGKLSMLATAKFA